MAKLIPTDDDSSSMKRKAIAVRATGRFVKTTNPKQLIAVINKVLK